MTNFHVIVSSDWRKAASSAQAFLFARICAMLMMSPRALAHGLSLVCCLASLYPQNAGFEPRVAHCCTGKRNHSFCGNGGVSVEVDTRPDHGLQLLLQHRDGRVDLVQAFWIRRSCRSGGACSKWRGPEQRCGGHSGLQGGAVRGSCDPAGRAHRAHQGPGAGWVGACHGG